MSVEKKNAYIGVDLGDEYACRPYRGDRLVAQGSAPTPKDAADCESNIGGFDRGDPFRVGRECGSYRYRCAERGGS